MYSSARIRLVTGIYRYNAARVVYTWGILTPVSTLTLMPSPSLPSAWSTLSVRKGASKVRYCNAKNGRMGYKRLARSSPMWWLMAGLTRMSRGQRTKCIRMRRAYIRAIAQRMARTFLAAASARPVLEASAVRSMILRTVIQRRLTFARTRTTSASSLQYPA